MSFLDKISEYFSSHDNLIYASTGKLIILTIFKFIYPNVYQSSYRKGIFKIV